MSDVATGPVVISPEMLTKIEPGCTYAVVLKVDEIDPADLAAAPEWFYEMTGATLVIVAPSGG